jgi:hypothetical protein
VADLGATARWRKFGTPEFKKAERTKSTKVGWLKHKKALSDVKDGNLIE